MSSSRARIIPVVSKGLWNNPSSYLKLQECDSNPLPVGPSLHVAEVIT